MAETIHISLVYNWVLTNGQGRTTGTNIALCFKIYWEIYWAEQKLLCAWIKLCPVKENENVFPLNSAGFSCLVFFCYYYLKVVKMYSVVNIPQCAVIINPPFFIVVVVFLNPISVVRLSHPITATVFLYFFRAGKKTLTLIFLSAVVCLVHTPRKCS